MGRRAILCNSALLVSFGGVYPFVDGRALSAREELIKQLLSFDSALDAGLGSLRQSASAGSLENDHD